jgi:hypothetical protein
MSKAEKAAKAHEWYVVNREKLISRAIAWRVKNKEKLTELRLAKRQESAARRMTKCAECSGPMVQPQYAGGPRRFCSSECRYAYHDQRRPKFRKVCPVCNTDFFVRQGDKSKHCSKTCALSRNSPIRVILFPGRAPRCCATCDKAFDPKTDSNIYCSPICGLRPRTSFRCLYCGNYFTRSRGSNKYCGRECAFLQLRSIGGRRCVSDRDVNHTASSCSRHIKRAKHFGVPFELFDPRDIYERDQWLCGICGQLVDPKLAWPDTKSASLDHVIPLALGGGHLRSNARVAHLRCNVVRSSRIRQSDLIAGHPIERACSKAPESAPPQQRVSLADLGLPGRAG